MLTLFRILLLFTMLLAAQQLPLPWGWDPRFLLPYSGGLVLLVALAAGVRLRLRFHLPRPLLFFVGLGIASSLASPAPWITLPVLLDEVLLSTEFLWILALVILLTMFGHQHARTYLLSAMVLLAIQQILMGGYQFFLLKDEIWGSFRAPNLVARFVLLAWPFLAAAVPTRQEWWKKVGLGLIVLGLGAVLALSFSRMAWLALIVQSCYFAVKRRNRLAVAIAGSVVLVILLSGSWWPILRAEDMERILGWRTAVELSLTYPLLGIGPGMFGLYYSVAPPIGASELLSNTHSLWLHLACEFGLLSLPIFLWFVISGWRSLVRLERQATDSMDKAFLLAARVVIVGLIVQSLMEY